MSFMVSLSSNPTAGSSSFILDMRNLQTKYDLHGKEWTWSKPELERFLYVALTEVLTMPITLSRTSFFFFWIKTPGGARTDSSSI
jgi:hypothetical protein